jgi:hypothetical protein
MSLPNRTRLHGVRRFRGKPSPLSGFCRHGDSWSRRMCFRSAGRWPIIPSWQRAWSRRRRARHAGRRPRALNWSLPANSRRTGTSGRTNRRIHSAGTGIRPGGSCCSRGSRPGTAAVIRSRPKRRTGWPRRSACRTATRGFIPPGCTTMPGSARPAACHTAPGTGRSAGRATGTAQRVTARAWTRTGRLRTSTRDR